MAISMGLPSPLPQQETSPEQGNGLNLAPRPASADLPAAQEGERGSARQCFPAL